MNPNLGFLLLITLNLVVYILAFAKSLAPTFSPVENNVATLGDSALETLNLTSFCITRTGYAQAKVSDSMLPPEYCKVLKCDWIKEGKPKIRTVNQYIPPENSYPCGYNGKCVKKACVGQSQDRFDMNKLCQYFLRNPKSRVTLRAANTQCSKLSCSFPNEKKPGIDKIRDFELVPEDGSFPCGNKRGKCKNKVCMGV